MAAGQSAAYLVHVYGVNDTANRYNLADLFSQCGRVVAADLIGRGNALVGFFTEDDAETAIRKLNFVPFENRILAVSKSILFTEENLARVRSKNHGYCLQKFFCYDWNVYTCPNALPGEECLRGKHACFHCSLKGLGEMLPHRNRDRECPSRTRGWKDLPQFDSAEDRSKRQQPQVLQPQQHQVLQPQHQVLQPQQHQVLQPQHQVLQPQQQQVLQPQHQVLQPQQQQVLNPQQPQVLNQQQYQVLHPRPGSPGQPVGMLGPGGRMGPESPGGTMGMVGPGGRMWPESPGGTMGMMAPDGRMGLGSPGGTMGMMAPDGRMGLGSPGGTMRINPDGWMDHTPSHLNTLRSRSFLSDIAHVYNDPKPTEPQPLFESRTGPSTSHPNTHGSRSFMSDITHLYRDHKSSESQPQLESRAGPSTSNNSFQTVPSADDSSFVSNGSTSSSYSSSHSLTQFSHSFAAGERSSSSTLSRMSDNRSKPLSGVQRLKKSHEKMRGLMKGSVFHTPITRQNKSMEREHGNWFVARELGDNGDNGRNMFDMGGVGGMEESHPWDNGFNVGVGENWGQEGQEDDDNIWF